MPFGGAAVAKSAEKNVGFRKPPSQFSSVQRAETQTVR